ncbi:MAG TPA: phage tail protein [Ilumatobacteraceae bacterium]|jgi:phage tail-like protein
MPQLSDTTQYGLVMRFDVVVDGIDLGAWSSCDGLKVDFGLKEIKVGGNNECKVYLPDRVNYPKLVLKRAMTASDSGKVMSWLRSMVDATDGGTATVTLRDSHNQTVSEWTFANARPSSWKGPTLNATGKEVATEILELVHEGFL